MLCPAPQVHASFPGSVLIFAGQFFATSYGPNGSWPPTSPGTAAILAAPPCPCTVQGFVPKENPITHPMPSTTIASRILRMTPLFQNSQLRFCVDGLTWLTATP